MNAFLPSLRSLRWWHRRNRHHGQCQVCFDTLAGAKERQLSTEAVPQELLTLQNELSKNLARDAATSKCASLAASSSIC